MLSQIPTAYQRPLAIGLPLLCLLVALLLLVPRYRALQADERELARTRTVIRDKKARIAEELSQPLPPPVAYVPGDRTEPVVFLRELSQLAAACGVKFTSVTTTSPEAALAESGAANSGGGNTGTTAAQALPTGVTPIALQISVRGPFAAHVRFFERLENHKRLVSVTSVSMDGSQHPNITSQFRLTRFVGPVPAVAPAPAPAAGASPAAGQS